MAAAGTVQESGAWRPQLDGLRAIAVGMVVFTHLWFTDSIAGSIGVRLFFVLSGFLITNMLVGMRAGDAAFSTGPQAWLVFFTRRALRLWPAYYLLLAVVLALNVQQVRDSGWWHILYLSNVYFGFKQGFDPWIVGPFWTLAIEQQFYLIWPFLMLVPPRRWLLPLAIGAILFALGWHLATDRLWPDHFGKYMLLPASMDALGAGAAMALAWRGGRVPRWLILLAVVAVPVVAALLLAGENGWLLALAGLPPMMLAVALCHHGMGGPIGACLSSRPLTAIGKISYGIYLYHMIVMAALFRLSAAAGHAIYPGPVLFVLGGAATIGAAALSWRFIEAPANRLKRHFRIGRRQPAAVAA
jgi:peptidoglycan/LPS O-acetylase OafA/YrhL